MYVFAYIKLYNVRGYKFVTVNLKDKNRKKSVFKFPGTKHATYK